MSDDDNVVLFNGVTTKDLPPDLVLEKAKGIKTAVVVGWDDAGEFYFATSAADGGEVLVLLELAKRKIVDIIEDGAAQRQSPIGG